MNEGGRVRISAVVCTLNRAAYLAKAVESLINQTYPKEYYEIIVVDNGSTDNTREVVEQFGQFAKIRYIYEPTKGLCQARNTGWQAAGGKYVAYLDDDAIACPRWLEKMMESFETIKPAPASVGGRAVPIWECERPAWLEERILGVYAIVDWGNHARFLKPSSPERHVGCNVAYSRKVLQECGGFNINLGRKGKNLLSNDEHLIRKYMDSHGLGIYYNPEILVDHLVPKERLTRRFMLRRHFWQGISDVVEWYEESPSPPGRLWCLMSGLEGLICVSLLLMSFLLRSFLRAPLAVARELSTIETARNYLFRRFDRFCSSFGQACAYLQIGMGRLVKGTRKGVALQREATDSSRPPPKYWNRMAWWSHPYVLLKRNLLGIGGIAILAIAGLYIAGALVEPLRWYLVGIASGLLLLCGGILVLTYARLLLETKLSAIKDDVFIIGYDILKEQNKLAEKVSQLESQAGNDRKAKRPPKKTSNEDDGASTVCSQFNNGLQHMDEFSHVAYCTGPAQLAYLLSAFEVYGISPGDCLIYIQTASSAVDLLKTLPSVCGHIGMKMGDASLLPSPTLKETLALRRNTGHAHPSAFWYCWAGRGREPIMRKFRRILPDMVFEYYDGFRSPVVALEQGKNRLSLSDANHIGDLRQLAVERLLRPDGYFMLDDGLFTKYAPTEAQRRTHYIPLNVAQDKIRLVGQMLDEIDGGVPLEDSPGAVLLPGMFSERREFASPADELKMYDDLLGVIRSVSRTTPILVKPHPRTSPEKMHGLGDICAKYKAELYSRQQLIEYILDKSGRRDVAVIGPPSTALLSTIQFGYGRAFCPSQQLMASYIDPEYANDPWITSDHELMETAGVNMVNSLQELADMLRREKTS